MCEFPDENILHERFHSYHLLSLRLVKNSLLHTRKNLKYTSAMRTRFQNEKFLMNKRSACSRTRPLPFLTSRLPVVYVGPYISVVFGAFLRNFVFIGRWWMTIHSLGSFRHTPRVPCVRYVPFWYSLDYKLTSIV